MRRAVLLNSVQRLLTGDESVTDAAYGWSRHRLMIPFAAVVFIALVFLAILLGYETWSVRLAIGAAGAAVAVGASTTYFVVAATTHGVVLCRASMFRQVAREIISRYRSPRIELVAGTGLATDWEIDGRRVTVSRSSEKAMHAMARAS